MCPKTCPPAKLPLPSPPISDDSGFDEEITPSGEQAERKREEQEKEGGKPTASEEGHRQPSAAAGEVLMLSPGGVREALFADEYYSVLWGKRRGFARVAIRAKRVSRFLMLVSPRGETTTPKN